MNAATRWLAAAALCIPAPVVAQFVEEPVAVRTEGLPTHLRLRVEEKAQEGATALIHYVNRTRMMGWQLRVEEIVAAGDAVRTASRAGQKTFRVATRGAPRAR